jgi:glycerol kinase
VAHVLALDQGTTSSRAILFDDEGSPVASAQREFRQIYPQAGWVEHDPEEIWTSQIEVGAEALSAANLAPRDLAAVGITNQRETGARHPCATACGPRGRSPSSGSGRAW